MTALLAFLSGFSALLYQILWAREFAVVLGSTTHSISTVLAAFMAGLGIGGMILGSAVDKSKRHPLRIYAAIEIGVALAALFAQIAIQFSTHAFAGLYNLGLPSPFFYALRFLVTFTVLCIPTFFMGGTLPALVRDRRTAGWIYGANTIGAAAGAFTAGFFLIERFGLRGTLTIAVAINIAIAGMSWLVSVYFRKAPSARQGVAPVSTGRAVSAEESHRGAQAGLWVYAVSGFVSLGLEVVWSRTLVFSIGSTTYAFSMVLVIVLLGLAMGSFFGARLSPKTLAFGPLIIAIFSLASLWIFHYLAVPMRNWLSYAETLPWNRQVLIQFVQASVLLLPSALVFGAIFPIAAGIYLGTSNVASRLGRLLGANTFAAIAGSLLTGFVLIPLLGIQWTYAVLGSASFIAFLYACRKPWLFIGWAALLAATVSGSHVLEPVLPTEKLLFYKEGTNGTISVVEDVSGDRNLLIDHIAVAGTDPIFMTDQQSLAHLPMLLHPEPKRALTVGFGSGGASYSFTRYPGLESVRAVEIDPAVFEAAPYFKETNGDPFADPRFGVIRDDARTYLLYTRDSYDIITTDCTDLRYKSNALLYTKEFFESARLRLNPGGMVVAWVPLGGLSSADLRTTLKTFSSSFSHSYAWYLYNYPTHYLLVVGTTAPLQLDLNRIRERMAIPAVQQDLSSIHLDDPLKLMSSYIKDSALLLKFTEGAPINSDFEPVLEFSVPKSPHAFSLSANLEQFTRETVELSNVPDAVLRARAVLLEGHVLYNKPGNHYGAAAELYKKAQLLNPDDRSLETLIKATQQTALDRRKEYELLASRGPADSQIFNELGLLREDAGDLDGALASFERAAQLNPSAPVYMNLGRIYDLKELPKESISAYQSALRFDPNFGDAWNNIGIVYLEQGDNEKAFDVFQKAVHFTPQAHTAWLNLGLAAMRSGRPTRAREAFDRALGLNSRYADAYLNRAILRLSENDAESARTDLELALAQQPDYAEAHYNLGIVEEQRRRPEAAAAHYRRAIDLNPRHVLAHNNLGILYSEGGQSKLAIEIYMKAIAIDPRNSGLRNNLAMEYVRLGNLSDAIVQYQEAIALQPGMFEPYANLGMIYRRTKQTAKAEEYLAEARKRNPNLKIP